MPIDFHCKGCGKHYRVRDELAGRAAECKQCGTKMVVPQSGAAELTSPGGPSPIGFQDEEPARPSPPGRSRPAPPPPREPEYESEYQSESSYESESSEMEVGAEPEDGPPSLRNFDVKDDAPEHSETRRQRQTPLLPDIVGERALPLVAIVACLGGAGFAAFKWATGSTNPLIAFAFMALGLALFFLVIVPLTIKGLEAAAKNIGFELANALKLQTVGLVAIPTGAIVLGYLNNGTSGAINWGMIGLLAMCVAIVLIYRTGVVKAALAAVWTGATYALTAGLSIGIAAVVVFGMSKAGVRMPWEEKPKPAVVQGPTEAEKQEEERKRQEAAAVTPPPVVEEAPKMDPTPPPAPAVTWTPIVDASTSSTMRWPADLKNQLIDVKPPVTLARSSPGSPFVAFVDGVALHVYDVRTAKRTGFIKDKPPLIGSLLSPDGAILIVNRRAQGNPQLPGGGAMEFEVWSLPESRLRGKLSLDTRRNIPQILGFDKDNRLITSVESEGKGLVQAWDTRSASVVREVQGPTQLAKPQSAALSAGGKFIACVADNRLNVFDLSNGTLVCDREMPRRDAQPRAMSFSQDGSQLAAVVNENNKNFLIVFNNETGDVALDTELGGGSRADISAEQMMWIPRGGALLIGNDWVDTATGKIVAILPPQTAGQSVGKPKLMFSDFQALVEFLPAEKALKVIYKGVSLNKKEIQAALADRRSKAAGDVAPADADAPVVVPATADAKELIRQTIDHLANDRAREALAFAQAAVEKMPKSSKAESDEHAIALHCLAAAHMCAGDTAKARDPIEKAAAYSKTSRALVLNRAKLDIASQNFVVRAVRDLDKQLSMKLDEEALNLMGLAISKIQPGQATPAQLKVFNDKYDGHNKKLEAEKPGMKHWGSQWISESDFATTAKPAELVEEKSKGEERVKLAAAELERTRKAFADAKKQALYDERKKDIPRDSSRKNQPMYLSQAEDAFAAAQKEVDAAKLDLEAIIARFPKPPFEENLEPTLPEMELVARTP